MWWARRPHDRPRESDARLGRAMPVSGERCPPRESDARLGRAMTCAMIALGRARAAHDRRCEAMRSRKRT